MILATIIIIIIILAKFTFRPPRRILRSRNPVDWGGGKGTGIVETAREVSEVKG